MLKNKKGVTYLELLITVVVVIILSVISFKIHAYNTEKAVAVDGVNLMRKIIDAEIAYRLENRKWCLSFAELPITLEGELKEGSADIIKTKDFIYSLEESGTDGRYLSINAVRNYFDKYEIDQSKEDGYSMCLKVDYEYEKNSNNNNNKVKLYTFTAKSYNVYAILEKAVVNYLINRFSK